MKITELTVCQKLFPQLIKTVLTDFQSQKISKELKTDKTPIAETDLKVDRLIRNAIMKVFPGDKFLSEELEGEMSEKGRLWVIDPICGSSNFAAQILLQATNIALFKNNQPVFAFVVDYALKTYYWSCSKKEGVYQEQERIRKQLSLDTPKVISFDQGYLPTTGSVKELEKFGQIIKGLIKKNYYLVQLNTSLAFTYAALARYGSFMVGKTRPWDISAACYLMEKNGGVVTDFANRPWCLSSKNIIASLDKKIHHRLLKIIQEES